MLLCTYTTLNSQDKGHLEIKPEEILKTTVTLPVLPPNKREEPPVKELLGEKGAKGL